MVHMLTMIAQTLAQNTAVNASANAAGLKTPEALLRLLHNHNQLTRQQLADLLDKDIHTIARALVKLQPG